MPQIVTQPIRTRIRYEILERIFDGRLGPRQPVRLAEIAQDLGVSVTPLREALIELETEGLLEARPNRGFIVAPFRGQELRDLYSLIATLETTAVRSAPPSPRRLERLEQVNRELAAAADDPWRVVQLDIEWHRELIAEAPNAILKEVVATLKLRAVRYAYAYLREAARTSQSVEQHAEIIARLRRGEIDEAVRALEGNWRPRVMLRWVEHYEGNS